MRKHREAGGRGVGRKTKHLQPKDGSAQVRPVVRSPLACARGPPHHTPPPHPVPLTHLLRPSPPPSILPFPEPRTVTRTGRPPNPALAGPLRAGAAARPALAPTGHRLPPFPFPPWRGSSSVPAARWARPGSSSSYPSPLPPPPLPRLPSPPPTTPPHPSAPLECNPPVVGGSTVAVVEMTPPGGGGGFGNSAKLQVVGLLSSLAMCRGQHNFNGLCYVNQIENAHWPSTGPNGGREGVL